MNFEILKAQHSDGIAVIKIDRPQSLNALNSRFFDEMDEMLDQLASDKTIRAVIITGEGKAFVAGADIAEMVNKGPAEGQAFSEKGQKVFRKIEKSRFPVIAAINGFALGGGLELAMSCDFRIASNKARFGQPEVNLGLIPGYAGTQRLPRLTGLGNALYLLLTAEMIDAATALQMGLVQKVTEPETLMEESLKIAGIIVSKGPKAIEKAKKVTRKGLLSDFGEGCKLEAEAFGTLFGPDSEGEEGMKAFLEKRKPNW
ncbi:MAG: enoyl-CoA hydratase/isomerase family protein [Bacteroidales bacterium]|nr:enoyl-CoA hydratase/isomerase family protein [Bacteroidales bacterium]